MPPFQPGCCRGERCKSGTGENIATAVIDYLESVGVSTADTEILGADGTTVNTGHLNGSMRNMELRLGRPLQRAVCTLHQAELPLRKMFEHLDGPTTGPRSYSGPIGKLLKSDQLHLTPLNHHFTPLHLADIPPLSPEVKEKMSTDAVLLHDLSQYQWLSGPIFLWARLSDPGIPVFTYWPLPLADACNTDREAAPQYEPWRTLLQQPGAARHIHHRNILHWTHGGEVQALYN